MAEQFAVADLYQNAIDVNGHRFIRTAFKVRDAVGKRALYYCPSGQITVAGNVGVDAVDDNGSKSELAPCRYLKGPVSRLDAWACGNSQYQTDTCRHYYQSAAVLEPTWLQLRPSGGAF